MATGKDLARMLRKVRHNLEHEVPKRVAKKMLEETRQNFREQSYGNNEQAERWKPRHGFIAGRGFGNAEPYLRYKMLQYTGKLAASIKATSGRGYASLSSSSRYAEQHNTGRLTFATGNSFRRPPASSEPIRLGSKPVKRQFMGVGERTYKIVLKEYGHELKRLT